MQCGITYVNVCGVCLVSWCAFEDNMASAVQFVLVFVCFSGCYGLHVDPARTARSIHMDGIGLSSGMPFS